MEFIIIAGECKGGFQNGCGMSRIQHLHCLREMVSSALDSTSSISALFESFKMLSPSLFRSLIIQQRLANTGTQANDLIELGVWTINHRRRSAPEIRQDKKLLHFQLVCVARSCQHTSTYGLERTCHSKLSE